MTQNHNEPTENDLKTLFEGLSGPDRAKLKFASFVQAVTGIMRDDTEKHPWKFPFYALYLLAVVEPIPTGGVLATLTGIATWKVAGLNNEWSRWVRGRLTEAFDDASIANTLRRFIVEDEAKPGAWRIDNMALAKFTASRGWKDSSGAAMSAFNGLQGFAVTEGKAVARGFGSLSQRAANTVQERYRALHKKIF